MTHRCPQPLGLAEIATFLGTAKTTPTRWRYRRVLPPPDGTISGTVPYWWDTTIEAWAARTGHGRPDRTAVDAEQERRRHEQEATNLEARAEQLRQRQAVLTAELAAAEAARAAALEAARAASHAAALAG